MWTIANSGASIKDNKLERIYCLSYDYDNTACELLQVISKKY